MLDQAFDALKTYDWGADKNVLNPIEEAVVATHGDAGKRAALEGRLAAVLKTEASRDAKDYVCRKLMIVGTAASVPTLAELLPNAELSHMARYALERIPAAEAGQALRDALAKTSGPQKVGVISSLGVRGEAASVEPLAALVANSDAAVSRAAAYALGDIRGAASAKALTAAKPASAEATSAVIDASFACAESLLAEDKKLEALVVYKAYIGEDQPKQVRLAATRGMLACAGKKE